MGTMKTDNLVKSVLLSLTLAASLAACFSLQMATKEEIATVYQQYENETYQEILRKDGVLQGASEMIGQLSLAIAFALAGDEEAPKDAVASFTDGLRMVDHADYLRRKALIAFDENKWDLAKEYQAAAVIELEQAVVIISKAKDTFTAYWESKKPKDSNMVF